MTRPDARAPSAGWGWTAAAVLASAAASACSLLRPARGLTFLWDDWVFLERLRTLPRPRAWLEPYHEHWKPIFLALVDAEHSAFGANHTLWLAVTWAIHVLNVALLARLLGRRCQDPRVAALGAAAFGLTTADREVLWWAELGGLALCFTICAAGFLALDEALRASRPGRWLALAALAAFAAPLAFGSGLALGPALALEALLLGEGAWRRRAALACGGAWALHLALYVVVARNPAAATVAATPAALLRAFDFAAHAVGLGVVHRNLFPVLGESSTWARGLALGYASAAAAFALRLRGRERRRFLLGQAFLALVIAPAALTRTDLPALAGAWSRYQYLPAIAWTTALVVVAGAISRRGARPTLGVSAALLLLVAVLNARAARDDTRPFAPRSRRAHAELVRRLGEAVAAARGPVWDAPLPVTLAWPGTRASSVLAAVRPDLHPRWTAERTEESLSPYSGDEALRSLVEPRASGR